MNIKYSIKYIQYNIKLNNNTKLNNNIKVQASPCQGVGEGRGQEHQEVLGRRLEDVHPAAAAPDVRLRNAVAVLEEKKATMKFFYNFFFERIYFF